MLPPVGGVALCGRDPEVKPNDEGTIVPGSEPCERYCSAAVATSQPNRLRGGTGTVGKRLTAILAVLLMSGAAMACSSGSTTSPSASASASSLASEAGRSPAS